MPQHQYLLNCIYLPPMQTLHIHPDIRLAETPPAWFYRSAHVFEQLREKVFTYTWQFIGDTRMAPLNETVYPFTLLEHFIDEPMLLTRCKNGQLHNLSNVCTHRANLLVHHPAAVNKVVCKYHGRRFGLEGNFESMPEFKEALGFPRPCDNLHTYPLQTWEQFLFTAIQPAYPLQPVIAKMQQRIGFLPLADFVYDSRTSRDYLVQAHWALYCDNYLEGFHIPFVHKDLNSALDYGSYAVELHDYFVLQIGYADKGTQTFVLPPSHPDYGKHVAAYYYWLFPNTMLNFYPWGLSVNVVKPISMQRTRVSFLTYVYDEHLFAQGAAALIDKVEREDEFVVEGVQRGLQSRAYTTGRYSPAREGGVHHFHRLLAQFLAG
ncbi:MAG TPA: aromatic ring-hydroxylating dioxygenase subunit alpha [Chitinophagales bacterium]|nr:aromatic ring-hydroxylating dioxygenase subunit alpha [Chitinophagales bacterium]HRK27452.1 aromatic ring-hydroxylating dioxygenase subunit alpha [Chitinophagales bacterium]